MCGICGFISKQNITRDELHAMNETMFHRGPDDGGVEIYPMKQGYSIGLAQRRLAILDLSSLGHQPMHSADGRVSVVYNGEIYNFRQIREELKGYPFVSDCDTEVIIAAYLKWGISCVDHFNGMFAICLYDREGDTVYLIRDRIGKKPLYYEIEDGNLYFGSELKPLMKRPGFREEIRTDVLPRFLYQQYIAEPDTIFENVYKLCPGEILSFCYGEVTTWKYWDIKKVYHEMQQQPVKDYAEAKETLKKLLKESVKKRMIADVPLGAFLSGGYDSSLMTAIAQEISDTPVKTFTIGFPVERYNEAEYAKEVAEFLGTDHTELYIDENQMFELVSSIPTYYDEPFADSSQIATMLVSELARKRVTVALSGDGGDEFFCGYNVYDKVHQAQQLDWLGEMTHGICNIPGVRSLKLEEKLPFSVRAIAGNRPKETKTQFAYNKYAPVARKMVLGEQLSCYYPVESTYEVKDWQIRRMLLDMDTYLPGDILCKVDRASMKYSLEARCPILDKDVMEYSFRIPHEMKYQQGVKKKILKDIAYDYLPKELLERPKTGFAVPMDQWLHGLLKEQLLSYSDKEFLKKQGIFDPEYTSMRVMQYLGTQDAGPSTGANYSKLMWAFFVFQQWFETYRR